MNRKKPEEELETLEIPTQILKPIIEEDSDNVFVITGYIGNEGNFWAKL